MDDGGARCYKGNGWQALGNARANAHGEGEDERFWHAIS